MHEDLKVPPARPLPSRPILTASLSQLPDRLPRRGGDRGIPIYSPVLQLAAACLMEARFLL